MASFKRLMSPLQLENDNKNNKKLKLQSCETVAKKTNTEMDLRKQFHNDNLMDDFDEFNWSFVDKLEKCSYEAKLDLTKWQRCVVEDIIKDYKNHTVILIVTVNDENEQKHIKSKCYLKGSWCHTKFVVGDVISLKGVWDENLQAYKIDQEQGMCVIKPDILISGTTVVGSLFCRRKAVLQDRFRGIDANSKVMVIGSLVHELLQIVLEKNVRSIQQIETIAENLLNSSDTAFLLYSSQLNKKDVKLEILQYIPNIEKFIKQYVGTELSSTHTNADDFQGCIKEIQDIEENLWIPELGLKGKIDVSVRVKKHHSKQLINTLENEYCLPLELKTGKASFSMEHKGQLILYQMMLTAANKPTQSGLLLYLKEGIMREVISTHNEQRDLINLRNDLCHYLTLTTDSIKTEKNALPEGKFHQPFLLPEPITHPTACQQCPYNTLCCMFAKSDSNLYITRNHGIEKIVESCIEHLTKDDFDYFLKWCNLLIMEEKEAKKNTYLAKLWTQKPNTRKQQGLAICDLIISSKNIIRDGSQFLHEFQNKCHHIENTKNEDKIDFTLSEFTIGEYVIVSTPQRLAIAAGIITDLTANCIKINLERNLLKNYANETFIIDKHESLSNNIFNFTNLGVLMDNTDRSQQLRKIIIHYEIPKFSNTLPKTIAMQIKSISKDLNKEQRTTVLKALTTQSYLLIKGLPGTGKTQTLVAIIRLLNAMNKSIIITSHTHSVVDNLLLRLQNFKLPFLRLGSMARTHPLLHDHNENNFIQNCHSETELNDFYNKFNIVAVTCLGCSHPIFLHRQFDFCIVDEATQVMQPTVLRPLFYCERFILVGDPDQLPPLIRSKEARENGAGISLFERLSNNDLIAILSQQYRMNKTITKLANELTYKGSLKCATPDVQQATIKLSIPLQKITNEKWLQKVLNTHIDQAVIFLDTLNCSEFSINNEDLKKQNNDNTPNRIKSANKSTSSKYTNYCEAAIVFYILHVLLKANYPAERIGIIAPYRNQVDFLNKLLTQHHSSSDLKNLNFSLIEINTIDQYQGRDKDIIIYSCTRTGLINCKDTENFRYVEILEDNRRLTVALTRAKYKLIIIGDVECIKQYKPLKKLIDIIPGYCKIKLEDDKLDFKWQTVFKQLSQVQVDC